VVPPEAGSRDRLSAPATILIGIGVGPLRQVGCRFSKSPSHHSAAGVREMIEPSPLRLSTPGASGLPRPASALERSAAALGPAPTWGRGGGRGRPRWP
jgi:hypothetical protein